jgi:predicted flap endonuclease-1-like 5' DNA nuclease
MQDPYYINFVEFGLEKFKHILESEEVLPARQILKEDMDERFGVLASMGIRNLDNLISALSTKRKLAAFSQESRLPLDYLVILRREARSYIPKPVVLREIPGINVEDVEKLAAVGIKHSKHLFERGQTKKEREELAAATGVSMQSLLELVKLSDLARVRGIGPAFTRLFYETGADTIEKLSRWDPESLFQRAHEVNKEKGVTKVVPPLKDFVQYVAIAKDLPKLIEYQ